MGNLLEPKDDDGKGKSRRGLLLVLELVKGVLGEPEVGVAEDLSDLCEGEYEKSTILDVLRALEHDDLIGEEASVTDGNGSDKTDNLSREKTVL